MINIRIILTGSSPRNVLAIFVIVSSAAVVYYVIDFYGVKAQEVHGVIVSQNEKLSLKYNYRCFTDIYTDGGVAHGVDSGRCINILKPEQRVKLNIKKARFTGHIIVMFGSIKPLSDTGVEK